jgi:hypothetical protein
VKSQWISMLSPLKHVVFEYKVLIMKMYFDCDMTKFACENLELLHDLELILTLPCFMPLLKVVHNTLIKYVQCWNVFIINFVDPMNLVDIDLFLFLY